MASNERRSTINIMRLTVWPQVIDSDEKLEYGEPVSIAKVLMTAKDTPSSSTGTQEGDGQTVEYYSSITGGAIALGITAINSADRVLFYGETIQNGTNVTNKNDSAGYIMVAYMSERADGLVNLKKFPKLRFSPQEESESQKTKGGLTYSTNNLQGEYLPTLKNGDAKYVRYGVDPKTVDGKAIIESWVTDADFIGTEFAELASISMGTVHLIPGFSKSITSYAATTSNASNTITATSDDVNAQITISNGSTAIISGNAATWVQGENRVTITVTSGTTSTVYTIIVTKS